LLGPARFWWRFDEEPDFFICSPSQSLDWRSFAPPHPVFLRKAIPCRPGTTRLRNRPSSNSSAASPWPAAPISSHLPTVLRHSTMTAHYGLSSPCKFSSFCARPRQGNLENLPPRRCGVPRRKRRFFSSPVVTSSPPNSTGSLNQLRDEPWFRPDPLLDRMLIGSAAARPACGHDVASPSYSEGAPAGALSLTSTLGSDQFPTCRNCIFCQNATPAVELPNPHSQGLSII
jgi:hypothetical protein